MIELVPYSNTQSYSTHVLSSPHTHTLPDTHTQLEQERISSSLQSHTEAEREVLERRQREFEEREAQRRRDTP